MTCIECGELCESVDNLIQLALGHAIHRESYDYWLDAQDQSSMIQIVKRAFAPVVQMLPGEKGLSREQIAQRRHEMLYVEPKKQLKTSEARMESIQQVRPPVGGARW
ncbi:MAG: hypothetical protein WD851_11725 [Pirellulales bacterium]